MNSVLNGTGKGDLIYAVIQPTTFVNHQSWGQGASHDRIIDHLSPCGYMRA